MGKAYAASRQTEQAIAAASAIFSLNDDTFYDDSGYKAYSLAAIALALQAAGAEHEAKEVAITLVWTRKHGNEHRAIYGIARLAGAAKRAEHSNFFLQLLSADRAFAEASTEVLECRSDPKYLRLLLPMLREVGGSHYQEEYFRFLASYRALTVGLSPALWLDGIETPHMADGLKLLQMLSRTSDALETRRSIQTYLDSFRTREKYELLQLLRVFGRMITALKAHASSAELLAWTKNRNNLHHITLLKLGETAVRERQAPVALFKDQELPMNFHKELAVSLAALAARTDAAELVKQIREALISSSPIDQAAFEFSVADRLLDTSASDDFCDYFELHSLTP